MKLPTPHLSVLLLILIIIHVSGLPTNLIPPVSDQFNHRHNTDLVKREDLVHNININLPADGSHQEHVFMNEGPGAQQHAPIGQVPSVPPPNTLGGNPNLGIGTPPPNSAHTSNNAAAAASPKPVNEADLYFRFAFAGAVCSSVTHAALTPVDVVKTRIQLDPVTYGNGMLAAAKQIVQTEGPSALLTGLGPTFTGYFIQGAFKFGGYEIWKSVLINAAGGAQKAVNYRIWIYLVSAGLAEAVANIFLCPMEATRIRLVSQPDFATGMIPGFMRLVREEGYGGLYSGLGPMMLKQIPYTMTKFVVYEMVADLLFGLFTGSSSNNNNQGGTAVKTKAELSGAIVVIVNLAAGLIAGALAAVISQPADTLLSKINKEKRVPGESTTARLISLTKELGVRGLFLGTGARVVMVAILTSAQFAINGDLKRLIGATNGYEIAKA